MEVIKSKLCDIGKCEQDFMKKYRKAKISVNKWKFTFVKILETISTKKILILNFFPPEKISSHLQLENYKIYSFESEFHFHFQLKTRARSLPQAQSIKEHRTDDL